MNHLNLSFIFINKSFKFDINQIKISKKFDFTNFIECKI